MPAQALRQILAFCDQPHAWHDEQCTLAEFCAYIAADVMANIELAAEARVKPPVKKQQYDEADEDTGSEAGKESRRSPKVLELHDMGGGAGDDIEEEEDVPIGAVS